MFRDYLYPLSLAGLSLVVIALEYFFPHRKEQRQRRKNLGSDILHLVFNGHFLGVIFYGIASYRFLPPIDAMLSDLGIKENLYRNFSATWPLWLQVLVALLFIDFCQWCVHNALHRIPFLWPTHKCHHSVEDGEMDWIVSFRFQWTEVLVYRVVLYFPIAWFGFAGEAILFHAIFGTLIGHLNHSNLNITWGPLRYLLNSPNMHLWHHNFDGDSKSTKNFGIIFSSWDWIFGTAYMPGFPPKKIGFPGVQDFPKNFFAAEAWPLGQFGSKRTRFVASTAFGVVLLILGWLFHFPPS
ncbi:MAG: sterol desaturase family protein [Planctomycetota bacterium]|nr:sterol desaturase family protein [Planctomycetota bacterium]